MKNNFYWLLSSFFCGLVDIAYYEKHMYSTPSVQISIMLHIYLHIRSIWLWRNKLWIVFIILHCVVYFVYLIVIQSLNVEVLSPLAVWNLRMDHDIPHYRNMYDTWLCVRLWLRASFDCLKLCSSYQVLMDWVIPICDFVLQVIVLC